MASSDSFGTRTTIREASGSFDLFSLQKAAEKGGRDIGNWPFSIKILLESLLRNENGREVVREDIEKLLAYDPASPVSGDIPFKPARVILQDFTGVPSVVDLAALRSAMERLGGDPQRINPEIPVDLVIDHSVQVDVFGSPDALGENARIEFSRNRERYAFLRWGQQAFRNFGVVPPASGIVHQVNLEYLAKVVQQNEDGVFYPDTLVGTDSHTTMINGLGVLGWGVGGIEAEAVMLGQPIALRIPEVVGFRLTGRLPEGSTATDLVLRVTQMLREKGVVEKFVEFYGEGLSALSLPDRATIANMAPEYGATVGFFPVDAETLRYLRASGRDESLISRVEAYCRAQGLFRDAETPDPVFADSMDLDLSTVRAALAGPKRPQDRIELRDMKTAWQKALKASVKERGFALSDADLGKTAEIEFPGGEKAAIGHGAVVIAAITSCTNTSNPSVMLAAGLLAKRAVEAGLNVRPYVKTSLAPGSKVVTDYLERTGLLPYLEKIGFHVVGYGCTTCIGNSGPLPEHVAKAVEAGSLVAASVLSGNRNFEGRINPHVKANYLASPPLVVAYALAGTVDVDFESEPIGHDENGKPVYLKDIWPSGKDILQLLESAMDPEAFRTAYRDIESSNPEWNAIPVAGGAVYPWNPESTYIQEPPFFTGMTREIEPIRSIQNARVLVKVGDSVTTDHISPAGAIAPDSPAGRYLTEKGVDPKDFNSFGSRRGNDRVMVRGTFGNIRLKNQLAPGTEGPWTRNFTTGEIESIHQASRAYIDAKTPTLVLAGKDYGMGSSRDWAAKGTMLLGVKAVLAESFERIHRSNLVGMGVLPLEFMPGENADSLGLDGTETFTIDLTDELSPGESVAVSAKSESGKERTFTARCRLDTPVEVDYYRNGGILHTVLRRFLFD